MIDSRPASNIAQVTSLRKYIFLDTWVLSKLTDGDFRHRLGDFLNSRKYTILTTNLSLVELYNPGWEQARERDRVYQVAHFLGERPYAIVNPRKVFRAEIESFPIALQTLPVEDLESIPHEYHAPALLMFFRRHELFLKQGKDIKIWADNYERDKATWLKDVGHIIEDACENGLLQRNKQGRFVELEKSKEAFLLYLDRRHFGHFNSEERQALGPKIIPLFLEDLSRLPAIRLTSLCFWYAHVDVDEANKTRRKGSDIGDFYQISLIPYCTAFTTDSMMFKLLQRIGELPDFVDCDIIDNDKLQTYLSQGK